MQCAHSSVQTFSFVRRLLSIGDWLLLLISKLARIGLGVGHEHSFRLSSTRALEPLLEPIGPRPNKASFSMPFQV